MQWLKTTLYYSCLWFPGAQLGDAHLGSHAGAVRCWLYWAKCPHTTLWNKCRLGLSPRMPTHSLSERECPKDKHPERRRQKLQVFFHLCLTSTASSWSKCITGPAERKGEWTPSLNGKKSRQEFAPIFNLPYLESGEARTWIQVSLTPYFTVSHPQAYLWTCPPLGNGLYWFCSLKWKLGGSINTT